MCTVDAHALNEISTQLGGLDQSEASIAVLYFS